MSKNYHNANVLTQEVFIKVCCKDYLKSAYVQKTVPNLEIPEIMIDNEDTLEEFLLKQHQREAIIAVLNQLGEIYREVIILRFYEELKLEKITVVMNLPVCTVKSRLPNGPHHLKKLLKERGEELG